MCVSMGATILFARKSKPREKHSRSSGRCDRSRERLKRFLMSSWKMSLRSLALHQPRAAGRSAPYAGLGTREAMTAESSGARMKRLACSCCVGVTLSWRRVSKVVRLSSQPLKESALGSGSPESGK
jgi:hypothetical protein